MAGNKDYLKSMRGRYWLVAALMIVVALIGIFVSAFRIQVVERSAWQKWKEKQSRDSITVPALRGNIFSADGALMATSMPTYLLYIDFKAYTGNGKMKPDRLDSAKKHYTDTLEKYVKPLSEALASCLKEKTAKAYEEEIRQGFKMGRRNYRLTRNRIDYLTYQQIKTFPFFNKGRNVSGLHEKEFPERKMIFGSLASSTVGFVNAETGRGSYGLELAYDSLLRGETGLSTRRKVGGKFMNVVTEPPIDGCDLYTTIDLPVQDIVEKSLREAIDKHQPQYATAVLMEVSTGRIKAICNLERMPSGVYAENQNIALFDRSEPGSTFKTVSMMAALEEGRVKPTDKVDARNDVKMMYGRAMRDDHRCGVITAFGVIHQSSNIGMATLVDEGFRHGADARVFVDRIYQMGFQNDMHLEIPHAAVPVIPHPDTPGRYWAKTDLPWLSIGYVSAIPPIYTLSYYNAIANDGCYLRPYFVDRVQRGDEVIKRFEPTVLNKKICSDSTLAIIHMMLDSVPVMGTARKAHSDVVSFAGKTGTAVIGYAGGERYHQASFCGYFPADQPEYSCIVVVRRPKNGYSGGTVAAPVFKRIAEQVYAREHQRETTDLLRPDEEEQEAGSKPAPEAEAAVRDFQPGEVPDVTGLGLRDAITLLEEAHLNVYPTGHGKVRSQTPKAGSKCREGQTVEIRLR